ncbi:DeoR/GlpR family DNA-binding transcription regulator [Chryseobacterium sp. MEBOG06]|uniref:DeoR/GlpR family DNA-binding transcription regulator n=1 Tax=Chryseobacterium sp. MEBOG06 TaxID=2879938 RepID=UPI001F2D6DDE|nr:DeoR/GlpR family DNA-binding transcription regulator [Chryseobacterium sp. MEBOG06]UKB85205.1 DeoR/GlpR family DNA-binding transcription regulator [Chryseobacterium sp. MEBOG06]
MLKEERFEIILNELQNKKKVKFEDLAVQINVSEDTIRRDIDLLHRNGLLSKARGGAIVREKDPLTFHDRQSFLTKEKDIIALKTQQFLKNGMTVFMDGGTTIWAVVNYMPLDIKIRIITNNLSIVPIIEKFKNVELIILGGNYEQDLAVTSGMTTCYEVSKYIADLFIMGTCAVDSSFGVSSVSISDGETKKMMVQSSKKTIALASQNKLNQSESFKVCDLRQVSTLITDLDSDDSVLNAYRKPELQIV